MKPWLLKVQRNLKYSSLTPVVRNFIIERESSAKTRLLLKNHRVFNAEAAETQRTQSF